ncbi:hypothetical protein [Actinomadura sp. 6N118]|uniref:hypothetical protein n=1 Tax=Actinomadura sp. 6N118 TaxID=3375151 RepID=UPI0037987B4F
MWFRRALRRRDAELPGCSSCARRPDDPNPVLTCPGCGADSAIVATAIAYGTLNEGPQARACESCELVTIVVEPDMACPTCEQLYPDVNDRLRARFARVGPGDPADAPCVGCGKHVSRPNPPRPALYLDIDCQGCDAKFPISEQDMSVGQGMHIACNHCATVTVVPSTVWCPKCGQHLRKRGIPELVRDATRYRD